MIGLFKRIPLVVRLSLVLILIILATTVAVVLSDSSNPKTDTNSVKAGYACTSLTLTPIGRIESAFIAKASATVINGAVIESYTYNFGDGTIVTTTSATKGHIYATPGAYTATLTVNVQVNGQMRISSGLECQTNVQIGPVLPIEDQLRTMGYTYDYRIDASSVVKAGHTVYTHTWHYNGQFAPAPKTVYVTDAVKSGVFAIDNVSFGKTLGYANFWCYPPTSKDASNLAITIRAAVIEWNEVISPTSIPALPEVPGKSGVTLQLGGFCYLQ